MSPNLPPSIDFAIVQWVVGAVLAAAYAILAGTVKSYIAKVDKLHDKLNKLEAEQRILHNLDKLLP